jgi:hypothetical protein
MKGLDLSEAYWNSCGKGMIRERFGAHGGRIAAGMAGPGSECFGFDDEISRDHDWGPAFCLWLPDDLVQEIGGALQQAYRDLPPTFQGFGPRKTSPGEEDRVGVTGITSFYGKYTGLDHPPSSVKEWLHIPEQMLATCTNGRVFHDPDGTFSAWRERLLGYYPEDVRLKKIASRCITIAQAGQYNVGRSLKRGEIFAVRYAESQFCSDVMSLVFLLNRRYPPFYKWIHRAVRQLPLLGEDIHALIEDMFRSVDHDRSRYLIDRICALLVAEMKRQGLTGSESDFLLDHASSVHGKISDPDLGARLVVVR